MVRVDSTSIESVASKIVMAVEGAKLASICPTKSHYTCLRSEEVKVSHHYSFFHQWQQYHGINIPVKLVGLIKMYSKETCSKVHVGVHLFVASFTAIAFQLLFRICHKECPKKLKGLKLDVTH
jgi:hypothetical protein